MRRGMGFSMMELLVVLLLLAMAVAVALPALARMRSGLRTAAAAREIAISFRALRWTSVTSGIAHGWLFERSGPSWAWRVVKDGNGNGLRTAEVRSGTDPILSGPWRLSHRVQAVDPGFPPDLELPQIPPRNGRLEALHDPVKFGPSDLIAFSPRGSSSSGTLYLTDGSSLSAVVLYGPTTRTRIWNYDNVRRSWSR